MWERCPIDTKVLLMTCQKCGLLGHTKNHCPGKVTIAHEGEDPCCTNCYMYNKMCQTNGRPKSHYRTTNHDINYGKCPTRMRFRRKYIKARKVEDIPSDILRQSSTNVSQPQSLESTMNKYFISKHRSTT